MESGARRHVTKMIAPKDISRCSAQSWRTRSLCASLRSFRLRLRASGLHILCQLRFCLFVNFLSRAIPKMFPSVCQDMHARMSACLRRLYAPVQGLEDNFKRYVARCCSCEVQALTPSWQSAISAPTKSIRFPRLRDFNLSYSKRRYQDQKQSAAWYAACGTAFSNKPRHQTLGSVLRISSLISCETLDVSTVFCD